MIWSQRVHGRRQFGHSAQTLANGVHGLRVAERHPRGAVRRFETAAGRQWRAAIEDADVIEPEEPALEHVLAESILAVDPPGEVQHELVERRAEEILVDLAP